jgi:CubicO group peptidase (beta-lactamase class C family)
MIHAHDNHTRALPPVIVLGCILLTTLIQPRCAAPQSRVFAASPMEEALPMSGQTIEQLSVFDHAMRGLLVRWQIPGAALAVAKDGRLVLARGYGYADIERRETVTPQSLFRVASLSKLLTRSAVFKLEDMGELEFSDAAMKYLDIYCPKDSLADPRVEDISVRQLLDHTSGWSVDGLGFDPMFRANEIGATLGIPRPVPASQIISYVLRRQRLHHRPGETYEYSNLGYSMLGRIIEAVAGRSYEEFVKTEILAPVGITRMRIGRTRPEDRVDEEVTYYDFDREQRVESVLPDGPTFVPRPYGGFLIETIDSDGGWIASAIDFLRFIRDADPPPYKGNWSFNGSLPGSRSRAVNSKSQGVIMVALFNGQGDDDFADEITWQLNTCVESVSSWPSGALPPP